jgi:hypothetical protein
MDDGGWVSTGVRISANSFSLEEVKSLVEVLKRNFDLDCTIQNIYIKDKYTIYIKKNSIIKLKRFIIPYLHKSMYHKLGIV